MILRFSCASLLVACLGIAACRGAGAQSAPADPTAQAIIRAAAAVLCDVITRDRLSALNSAHGTVSYFRRYDMQVRTGANRYRDVHLHPGTVINPRGATPGAGSTVDINGRGAADGSLDADAIVILR